MPGPVGENLGDDLLVDDVEELHALGAPLGLHGLLAVEVLLLLLGELLRLLEGLTLDGRVLVGADLDDVLLELLVVRRRAHPADTQPAAGLVDEVDRLVRQEPVGQIAVGEVRGSDECLVGDGHRVVGLVAVAEALQDLDRVRHGRLVDLDRLEAPLESRVLLEVLAVLVEGGGTDRLELATGEHGLQDRGRVDGSFGGARTDEGVELVDEQDDVAPGADLLQDLLQTLFEVAAVTAACHEGAEVERVQLLALERLRHVVHHDALREALDDGGLADTRLADQHRVVLRAARQHLHDTLDLFLAPDDRVELVVASELGQVATELVEHRRATGRALRRQTSCPSSPCRPGSRKGAG